jgi:osmotically-inducible protein OsmY
MQLAEDGLMQRLQRVILSSPHIPRHRVRLENRAGHVVVRGAVDSYYQKQMTQEAILRVEGVEHLENQLEVHWA